MAEENPHLLSRDDRPGEEKENVEETEDDCAPLPPEMIAASFETAKPQLIEDNDDASAPPRKIASPFEGHGDEDDEPDEAEDEDCAPLPPEMIAASFETAKPKLIEDNGDVSASPDQIASPFEGHCDEEEKVEETEDDCAPPPPEMIAASFEAAKPQLIDDNDDTSAPPGKIASPFERHGNEEEKAEEAEDEDCAPLPPEMIAASYEAAKPKWIEDNDDASIPPQQIAASFGGHSEEDKTQNEVIDELKMNPAYPNNIQDSLDSIYERGTLQLNFSSISSQKVVDNEKKTTVLDPSSISPKTQKDYDLSLPAIVEGLVETGIYPTPKVTTRPHLSTYENNQSAPLLEATLVEDKPKEIVYDAIRIDPTQNDHAHGWSKKFKKYRFIILTLLSVTATAIIAVAVVASRSKKQENELVQPPLASLLWELEGQAIIGTEAGDVLGWAVALSGDARTVVAGAPGAFENANKTGYVEVYYKDDVMGLVQTIHGAEIGDVFGYSVDISADGKTLAVGAPGMNPKYDRPGYVRVYHRESSDDPHSSWIQHGEDIAGEATGDMFGNTVCLSDDGKTLAVAAYLNSEYAGHVRVYRLEVDAGSWKQLGQDIDGEQPCDNSGHAMSISADGNTVAIGAPYNSANGEYAGHAKVYRFDSDKLSWEQLGQTILGDVPLDNGGYSVALSANGKFLAVGFSGFYFYSEPDRSGYVRVYHLESGSDELIGSTWKQIGQNITGEAIGDNFGASVSLSDDAKTLAVGADYASGENGKYAGHVRVYRLNDSSSNWTQIGKDIDGDAADDYSGFFCISLSGNGKKVAIGSYGHDSNGTDSGQVRIFANEW